MNPVKTGVKYINEGKYVTKIYRPIYDMAVAQQKRNYLFCSWSYHWRNHIIMIYGLPECKYSGNLCPN